MSKKKKEDMVTEAFMGAVKGMAKIGRKKDVLKRVGSKTSKKKNKILAKVF